MGPKSVIVVAMLVLICGCGEKQKIGFQGTDFRYCEFAYEEPDYSEEYIIHGNGVVFAKTEEAEKTEILLGKIDSTEAEEVINETDGKMTEPNHGIDCGGCSIYHIFCGGMGETRSYSVRVEDAPAYLEDVREQMAKTKEEMTPADSFFLQFVYKRPKEDIVDYHFYSDGTVLLEIFGLKNGELKDSKILRINAEDVQWLKDSSTDGFYDSENNLEECAKEGFEWGYLGIQEDGRYGRVYTCGVGDSAADALFRKLAAKII